MVRVRVGASVRFGVRVRLRLGCWNVRVGVSVGVRFEVSVRVRFG